MNSDTPSVPLVVIVWGHSGHGKSTLAKTFQDEYGFQVISGDRLYVQFIKERNPDLFFPMLHRFIGPHYSQIVKPGVSRNFFDTDVIAHWTDYAGDAGEKELQAGCLRLVLEGYTFGDIIHSLEQRFARFANVRLVEMRNKTPWMGGQAVTVDGIVNAAL